ncbi:hypothetical protein HJC23_005967 [Cyclotella cryptica]|uniref:PHD-type domain-containing protein n=1 Tax=Cyclotella cryptica TaxID=29204 RepID=A0ABD3NW21_9STRA
MSSDATKDEGRTISSMNSGMSSSAATTTSTMDPTQRDWHVEILSGLFLRCTEQELDWLEEEASRTGLDRQVLAATHAVAVSSRGGGESVSLLVSDKDESANVGNKFASYLEEGSTDFSVLSLIPSALRGVCSSRANAACTDSDNRTDSPEKKPDEVDDFNRPLLIPSSWRRPNYESLTLSELERKIADSIVQNGIVDGIQTGCLYSENNEIHTTKASDEPNVESESYEMMTILYNECSLTAFANWAMMEPPVSGDEGEMEMPHGRRINSAASSSVSEVTPMQSPPHESAHDVEWDRYRNETSSRMASNFSSYNMPVPPCTFRMCGVCGKFGHYEVECELLLDPSINESQPVKKRAHHTQSLVTENGERQMMEPNVTVLSEDVRKFIISELAKEIRIQRLLQGLVEDTQREMTSAGFASKTEQPEKLQATGDSCNDEINNDDEQYISKSTCCNVCKSEMGGNRMLMCDGCDDLYHLTCLDPPLASVPEGEWLCSSCISYDSDVSSVVEIEGCGDFVIEQRKRSLAEREMQYSGVSLGQHQCQWSAALSFLTESDPIVDQEYLQEHVDDANHLPNFTVGKLCWAKRFDSELDRLDWWPAIIVEPSIETDQQYMKDFFTVRFFYLNETKAAPRSDILPYLSYYEDIGHKRLVTCENSAHNAFRTSMEQSAMALGLKSLGQAFKVSRGVTQKMLDTNYTSNTTHKKLKSTGWRPPVGWEHSEVEEIDDFIILSKEKHTIRFPQKSIPAPENESNIKANTTETSLISLKDSFSVSNDVKVSFYTDEVVGAVVSWCMGEQHSTSNDESLHAQYGIVVSVNLASQIALVRSISHCILHNLLYESIRSESVDLSVYEHDVGSTVWVALNQLRFVSAKPIITELVNFKATLRSRMKNEMKSDASRRRAAAITLEHNSIELSFNEDTKGNQHVSGPPATRDQS